MMRKSIIRYFGLGRNVQTGERSEEQNARTFPDTVTASGCW